MRISRLEVEYSLGGIAEFDLQKQLHPPGRLDLKRAALDQMAAAGLSKGCTIFDIPECTVCRKDLFFLFQSRRNG